MRKLRRYLTVEITVAEPVRLLNTITAQGVVVLNANCSEPLLLQMMIPSKDLGCVTELSAAQGGKLRVAKKEGVLWTIDLLRKRPVFVLGVCLFLLVTMYVPTRVLFIQVEGNQVVPTAKILEQAACCGITFGSSRRTVRSEEVKNELLSLNSDLQWVGINTFGCVATICVKERSSSSDVKKNEQVVSSIIASRDGVISQITALKGTAQYTAGQEVEKGDVLISGYTDCGRVIRAEQAQGEVFAYTQRLQTLIGPYPNVTKGKVTEKHTCYGLKIGKKVINFCIHSGIHSMTCDKMYSEKFVTLPGGFRLPISLIRRSCMVWTPLKEVENIRRDYTWLEQYSLSYLRESMIAGSISTQDHELQQLDNSCVLIGKYVCNEMIGKVKCEETLTDDA